MTNKEFLESISLDGEEWRDVVGYEGLYAVSNVGRIVLLERKVKNGNGIKTIKPRILELKHVKNGYLYVDLWANNKRRHSYVHRIIAQAWIDNPNGYTQIDHIDGDRLNNSITNLRWCTYATNNNNPISKARRIISRRPSKLENDKIACVKDGALIKTYFYAVATAKDGFNPDCVRSCLRGETKTHKGYCWMYLSDYEASNQ